MRLTGWPQPHDELGVLTPFLRNASPAPFARLYSRFKYVIDVDGNVQSTAGPLLLPLQSILLIGSRYRTAYSASMLQLPHTIRLRSDLSDLLEVVHCLRTHDPQALERVRQGSARAEQMLSYRSVLGYWAGVCACLRDEQHNVRARVRLHELQPLPARGARAQQ